LAKPKSTPKRATIHTGHSAIFKSSRDGRGREFREIKELKELRVDKGIFTKKRTLFRCAATDYQ
jgi:hypothetical protein